MGLAAAGRLRVDAHRDRCAGPWRMRRARFADAARSTRIVVGVRKVPTGPAPHRGMKASRARPSDDEASAPTERDGHDHRCQTRTRCIGRQQRPAHRSRRKHGAEAGPSWRSPARRARGWPGKPHSVAAHATALRETAGEGASRLRTKAGAVPLMVRRCASSWWTAALGHAHGARQPATAHRRGQQ